LLPTSKVGVLFVIFDWVTVLGDQASKVFRQQCSKCPCFWVFADDLASSDILNYINTKTIMLIFILGRHLVKFHPCMFNKISTPLQTQWPYNQHAPKNWLIPHMRRVDSSQESTPASRPRAGMKWQINEINR
jgi:hypothetical protein